MTLTDNITGQIIIQETRFNQLQTSIGNIEDLKKEIENNFSKDITQIMEVILAGAIVLEASDIHIEPEKENIRLRMRLDGFLHDVLLFSPNVYGPLLSRIKLLSGIKINVTHRSQDGRFSILKGENKIELRIGTLPSEYGESIVMRILNPKNLIEVEKLGIREDIMEIFKKEIAQPNGMIIVTGPTGSGKTTTLYAILKKIQKPEIKIVTIEDPIEYHLEGISQTQVDPQKGYDFATGLRAIVRQDPDAIMIGEIRDFETAEIALQASLTGHLVLSTLHTNDAAGTIIRLQSLGEKLINIAPSINLIVAQRLIRKVCKKCSQLETPTKEEFTCLSEGLKSLPQQTRDKIKIPAIDKNLKISHVQGCKDCNFTGYKGRLGIYELFLVDDEMENFILKSPSIPELRQKAREKGMVTIKEDGLIKVLFGITTIKEVEIVAGA